MTSIDTSSKNILYLRTQIADLKKSVNVETSAQQKSSIKQPGQFSVAATTRGGAPPSILDTLLPLPLKAREVLLRNIRNIAKDDPLRNREVFRSFLESVITHEFTNSMAPNNSLDALIDRVLQQMESDDDLNIAINDAAMYLIDTANSM